MDGFSTLLYRKAFYLQVSLNIKKQYFILKQESSKDTTAHAGTVNRSIYSLYSICQRYQHSHIIINNIEINRTFMS